MGHTVAAQPSNLIGWALVAGEDFELGWLEVDQSSLRFYLAFLRLSLTPVD